MIDEALEDAKKLDLYFQKTGRLIGLLHGVPISVKEMVHFKNRICHTAYVSWIDRIAPDDALIIRILRGAGALFHVRTNEPQTVMVLYSNHIMLNFELIELFSILIAVTTYMVELSIHTT